MSDINQYKKVLFVSNTYSEFVNEHILDAFKARTGLILKDIHPLKINQKETFFSKLFVKLKIPLDQNNINQCIVDTVGKLQPDIVFIVKGNNIYPKTLKRIKIIDQKIKLISWSLDDMYAWHNRSLYYTQGLKFYDIVFTTKSYNLIELKKIGANKVHFLYQAFSNYKHLIKKNNLIGPPKRDIGFIGHAEGDRFKSIEYLAINGFKVDVYGSGWDNKKYSDVHKNIRIYPINLLGDDYSQFISSSRINLCFLRKKNRDLHTSRSLEIPACGGFMLAERTREHENLFVDKKEAVFFEDNIDLLNKVKYYLSNDYERIQIRDNGIRKCIDKDYSYDDMLDRIFSQI